ncbi:MAG TPA: PilX N-terminal domain-containing pilus assembly protein [Steroidobacteraceae bacterium]|nr:PilX N-terminal domain-containing pilus assembly protein [Steroidobacteraceae bacterium]
MAPRQRGAALVVSLLLLLVLTILAIGASQTTRLEERMAGNMRDIDMAFQGSEAGLRDAEKYIATTAVLPTCLDSTSASCYVLQQGHFAAIDLGHQTEAWWRANGKPFGGDSAQQVVGVVEEPRYVIEEFQTVTFSLTVGHGAPPGKTYYKSTSWSPGATPTSHAVVESVFSRE